MTIADPTKLLDAGALGIVVFLVVTFFWYLDRRDKSWQSFIDRRDKEYQEFFARIVTDFDKSNSAVKAEVGLLRADFNQHTQDEMQRFDVLIKQATQPRRGAAK